MISFFFCISFFPLERAFGYATPEGAYFMACGVLSADECCVREENKYPTSIWEAQTDCDCQNMKTTLDNLQSAIDRGSIGVEQIAMQEQKVLTCISKVDEYLKRVCTANCRVYIAQTTKGCPDSMQDERVCQEICLSKQVRDHVKELGTFSQLRRAVENKLPREKCIEDSKTRFISAYKSKCLEAIKHLENEKGNNAVLLCGATATEQNNNEKCSAYCETKARKKVDEIYNPAPTGEAIHLYHMNQLSDSF